MEMNTKETNWILEQHRNTNHFYDTYLPYEFHLRMVIEIAKKHILEIPEQDRYIVLLAAFGHDLIEDTRVSYNDVKTNLGENAADIIYALSNEKGKNRAERANDKYYEGIVNTPYAVFVKLCDRIANVQYSIMSGSSMTKMYKKENENFIHKLGYKQDHELIELFRELNMLYNGK